jgi:hypothetical protein
MADDPPDCAEAECSREGAFWRYDGEGGWLPICGRHARHLHPSLEVHAWLEAGYMRPIERGQPDGPPPEPTVERGRAFRAEIDAVLGWSD